MIVKVHKVGDGRILVSVCDKELIGKVFAENELHLDLTRDFYNGDEMDFKEAGDLVRNADMLNLVGKRAVRLGIDENVIVVEGVVHIAGIPYAEAVVDK